MQSNDLRHQPVTIVGAGAIGGTIGAYLTSAGYNLTLVDIVPEHIQVMNESGLRITGIRGDNTFAVNAVLVSELQGPLGPTILAVKGHFTEEVMSQIGPMLADDGYVVSLQNGLNEEIIARQVGQARTVGCFIHFAADYLEPGLIQLSNERTLYLGELDGAITPRVQALREMLDHAMPAEVTTNIFGYLWGKMVWAGLGFVTACVDAPVADIVENPLGLALCRTASAEVYNVAITQVDKLEQIGPFNPTLFAPGDDFEERANSAVLAVGDDMRGAIKDRTGMWRDLRVKQRRTEVDMQPGVVVEYGRQLGIPTPVNAAVVEIIHQIEAGQHSMDWSNLDDIATMAGL